MANIIHSNRDIKSLATVFDSWERQNLQGHWLKWGRETYLHEMNASIATDKTYWEAGVCAWLTTNFISLYRVFE